MNNRLTRLSPLCRSCVVTTALLLTMGYASDGLAQPLAPRIFIQPQDGFESYISAAIIKKNVPAVVTQNKSEAQFVLTSSVESKEESAGSKIARCLFLYCAGADGAQTATVQLVTIRTGEVAWAYNVRKASSKAYQSTAESIAKHLKKYLTTRFR